MTTLETIFKSMELEKKRIEVLSNKQCPKDLNPADWYDFIEREVKGAKIKLKELQVELDTEYAKHN